MLTIINQWIKASNLTPKNSDRLRGIWAFRAFLLTLAEEARHHFFGKGSYQKSSKIFLMMSIRNQCQPVLSFRRPKAQCGFPPSIQSTLDLDGKCSKR